MITLLFLNRHAMKREPGTRARVLAVLSLMAFTSLFSSCSNTGLHSPDSSPVGNHANQAKRPNILIILSDDQGYADVVSGQQGYSNSPPRPLGQRRIALHQRLRDASLLQPVAGGVDDRAGTRCGSGMNTIRNTS